MSLRDDVEDVLRAWNRYEVGRGAPPVIDYDCRPVAAEAVPARSRLDVYERFGELWAAADRAGEGLLVDRIGAHLAYLSELLGVRADLQEYVRSTQGCGAAGWPEEYVRSCGQTARAHLDALGIPWGEDTSAALDEAEGPVDVDAAADLIRQAATEMEPAVRQAVGSAAPFDLAVEKATVDAYWGYWVDGEGSRVRLRLNLRGASFTKVRARQFALHEVLGHGLQGASFAERCSREQVPWVRMLAVHAQQQVLLEGLAQALPLFITPDDQALVARVRLAHYVELVGAELHLALSRGTPVEDCARHARARIPFWTAERVADTLSDRGSNPLLRTYLWSYPAGIDWFVRLADNADAETVRNVLEAAYRDPLTPTDLAALWPHGPTIGGPGPNAANLRS